MEKLLVASMSGGLDSATLVTKALEDGFMVLPVNFIYGQKNSVEIVAQKKLHDFFKSKYGDDKILETLTIDIEKTMKPVIDMYKNLRDKNHFEDVGEFYTPSRNMVFAVLSAQIAEIIANVKNIKEVYIGLGIHHHTEYREYWDITPEFADKLQQLFSLNDAIKMYVYAPYADKLKSDILKDAIKMGLDYKKTWTCYDPQYDFKENIYKPCKICEACVERAKAGHDLNISDINEYYVDAKEVTIKC